MGKPTVSVQDRSARGSGGGSVTFFAAVIIALGLASCGGNTRNVTIDYGSSDVYSKSDMDAAMKLIKKEFATWNGCELHSISYTSDVCNSEENLEWMNRLGKEGIEFTQCIEFVSDFHSPKDGGDGWNADCEYSDWQWWLARTDNGKWNLMTWGY